MRNKGLGRDVLVGPYEHAFWCCWEGGRIDCVKRKLNGWVIDDGGFQRYLGHIVHVRKWPPGERHQARKTGGGLATGDVVEGDCTLLGRGVAVGVTWLFTSASIFSLMQVNGSG